MRLPDLAPLTSPEPPSNVGALLLWATGIASFLKRLTDRHNETVRALHQLAAGHGHVGGSVTLTANAATTTVTHENLPAGALIFLTAQTANAAAEAGGTALYVAPATKGQFVITHVNSATTGRTFSWRAFVAG